MHDREPLAAAVPAGPHGARSVSQAPTGPAADALPSPPDDCFCCSHFVQPQVRYQVVPIRAQVRTLEDMAAPRPQFPASQLYHPPLA